MAINTDAIMGVLPLFRPPLFRPANADCGAGGVCCASEGAGDRLSLVVESGGMKAEILCKMSQAKCCILMQNAGFNGYTL
jgi:hypothetical protein